MKERIALVTLFLAVFFCLSNPCAFARDLRFFTIQSGEMPSPLSNTGVISHNGAIYLIGGNDEEGATSHVSQFNPETCSWTSLPQMKNPRFAHQVGIYANRIYCFGGIREKDGKTIFEMSIDAYDLKEKKWIAFFLDRLRVYSNTKSIVQPLRHEGTKEDIPFEYTIRRRCSLRPENYKCNSSSA